MSNIDEEARKLGIRFRHYYDELSGEHIATIGTRLVPEDSNIVDLAVTFRSISDTHNFDVDKTGKMKVRKIMSNKDKAKQIVMGRLLNGSRKFHMTIAKDELIRCVGNRTILDKFWEQCHPEFRAAYAPECVFHLRGPKVMKVEPLISDPDTEFGTLVPASEW